MEDVTAWLEQQGKSVNDKPATLYLNPMVNSEMSSVTHSVTAKNASEINIEQIANMGIPGTSVEGVVRDQVIDVDSNVNLGVPTTIGRTGQRNFHQEISMDNTIVQHMGENMETVSQKM